jgi:Uncharacterized conserved protein
MDKLQHTFLRYAQITLGCALYALGFCWFYAPNQLCMGGFTGLAQVISLFLPQIPIGVQVLLMNLPLFFLIWKSVGRDWFIASLYAMVVSSLFIDLLDKTVTFQAIEPVLACVYGAVLVGAGCGLMLRQNATVGGTNLAARLLRLRLERVSIGTLCSLLDGLIVVMHVIAFRNLSHCLYAVASLYLISLIMDRVVYGGKQSKVACIISDRHEELTAALLEMHRGITLLDGEGGFTHQAHKVILCVFCQESDHRPEKAGAASRP